jgi:hypothetical protein
MSTAESERGEHIGVESDVVPPAGEQIHLPGGSIIPVVVAIGTTLLVIGTTVWWVWSLVGFIILVVSIGIWIRDVRRDVDALPEDHQY